MAFKKYDSSYKRTESPFTLGVRRPGSVGPGSPQIDEMNRNRRAKEADEKNKEKLLEKAKGRMIKKAERKERKAAKKREYAKGNTAKLGISRKMAEKAAARKTRKATRIRKRAGELTADEVVAQRDRMRRRASSEMGSPYRKEKINVKKEVGKKAGSKALLTSAKKGAKKVGGKAARLGGRLLGPVGVALNVATLGKFLHKEEVGQKSVKNIGKGKGQGTFLGKA